MNANDDEQRRKRLRELQKMREQVTLQRGAGAEPVPQGNQQPQGNNQRSAKLSELLQRRQGANAGNPRQAGGGRLLQALAGRAGGGGGAGGGGMAGRQLNPDGQMGNAGNRGMLLRRIMQARQNRGEAQSSQYDQQLADLQNRVQQLTEEVERLRAEKAERETAADTKKAAAPGKKADRAAPREGNEKTS